MTGIDHALEKMGNRWFFYGWIIVVSSFLSSMINSGTGSYALGFFIIPMGDELHISRTQFSLIPIFKLVSLPLLPYLGILLDKKHGARVIVTVGSLLGGLILASVYFVQNIWVFFLTYGILYSLATSAMGSQLVGPTLIAKWFVRMRGRAMAIGTMGISAGGVIVAPVAGISISVLGWRESWIVLGLVTIVAIVPISMLFLRRSPEDINLIPDGDNSSTESSKHEVEIDSWTLIQVIKNFQFWILTVIQSLGLAGLVLVLFHEVAYIQDKGLNINTATLVATSLAFSAMVSKLLFGFLSEKVDTRIVLAFCFIPAGITTYLIIPSNSELSLLIWGISHGFFMGGFPTITGYAMPQYFGRKHLGSIRGAISPITVIISAISPLIGGLLWDEKNSYTTSFIIFGTFWIIGGILAFTLGRPRNAPSQKIY